MSISASEAKSVPQQQAFTIVGGGRIGQALAEMSPSSVSEHHLTWLGDPQTWMTSCAGMHECDPSLIIVH